MSRLTRDGTAGPVSRDQILRRERRQGNFHLPLQLTTSRIGNLAQLVLSLAIFLTLHIHPILSIALFISVLFINTW